jgi:hypothetical protein
VKPPPKSVIHINFVPDDLQFDPRPIWASLRDASERAVVPAVLVGQLQQAFGETAIHLATRHYIMKRAIEELKTALTDIYNQIPDSWSVPALDRVVKGQTSERARDHVLLATDSFLFEFRAYLDLLARFVHGILAAIGKGPAQTELLSSGKAIQIAGKNGNLKPHGFLLYLCDRLGVAPDWYGFLSTHRNFFTHEGAPYCAVEDRMVRPPEFDLIIMKRNIHDFESADPSDYFRVSECQSVVDGIRVLSTAAQRHLTDVLQKL